MPYAPARRPRRGRTALIVGLAVAVAVILTSGLGIAVYTAAYYAQHGAVPFVATPMPTATPPGTIVVQDPLTSNTNYWAVDPPYCQFANGGYQISDRICFSLNGELGNGSISVQARQIADALGPGFGIVLRRPALENFYGFGISGEGYWIFYKVVAGHASSIVRWTWNAAIDRGLGSENTLHVQFSGSHFDFFVNGTKVGQANDTTFRGGEVGLVAAPNTQVVFNDLTIISYD